MNCANQDGFLSVGEHTLIIDLSGSELHEGDTIPVCSIDDGHEMAVLERSFANGRVVFRVSVNKSP